MATPGTTHGVSGNAGAFGTADDLLRYANGSTAS